MDNTTLWNNIKNRVQYLRENEMLMGEGAEWAKAICEEIERIDIRLQNIEYEFRKAT